MKRAVLLGAAVAFIAVGAAACGGELHNARVSGVVKFCDGLTNKCFTGPVRISVTGPNGHVVARSHPSNGRFFFNLAPRVCTVSGKASGYVTGTVSVHAVAGQTTQANITNNSLQ